MAERMSTGRRIQLQHVAERAVMRYANDAAAWHKHVHNVDLDPMQRLKCIEMDQQQNTIDYSCRRTGKTAVKELYLLKHNATHPDQELGIVAPREAQAIVNLNYHLDAIRRSPILPHYLAYKGGRRQISDTSYQFCNRSLARSYGIMAQVDGGDLTAASLEEVDDMPRERLFSRFLLMMGANRRLGASQDSKNDPQIRITGVLKGADTLTDLIKSAKYHVVPVVDVYLAMEMGIVNAAFMGDMQAQLAPDEYIRQLLCKQHSARNLIWEKFVRRAMQVGLDAGLELAQPLPGPEYQKRGVVSFGYDHSGHGEDPKSSRYALVVLEQIGNFTCLAYCRTWTPGTDEQTVRRDLVGYWRYFRPDYAIGDAYGIGLLTAVNDDLYAEGLITIDRRAIGDGESTASTWPEWAFSPIRFEGMTKHSMAQATRAAFHNGQTAIPYLDDNNLQDADTADLRLLVRQLPNIRPIPTRQSYASYQMGDKKLGDDLFDAYMAAEWALVTRGAAPSITHIKVMRRQRQDLLGYAAA